LENTRIYKVLKNTTVPMLNRFKKFIDSPYFNVNNRLRLMTDILINDIKSKNAVSSKQKLWELIEMPGEYKDLKFRKLCNDLLERFEKFLVIEEMEKDSPLKSNLLIKSLKDNKLNELINKNIVKTHLDFERNIDISSEIHLHKYNYEKNLQSLKTKYEKKEDVKINLKKESFKSMSHNLDIYYFIEKLRHANDISTWTKQYKIEFNVDVKNIINQITEEQFERSPALKIYYLIYLLLSEEVDSDKYFELKELAEREIQNFPKIEQSEIFDALFSYCVKWVNKNDLKFHKEYLNINEWGISESFVLKNNKLSPTSFRNYVVIGLRIGEFNRVEKYITDNIYLLDKSFQENALNFNLARVSFYKKEFNLVLDYLNKVNYADIWYNLNSKILLMAAYYELDEIFALEAMFDSYSIFLRREKSLETIRKKRHLDFITILKKLVNFSSKDKLQKIKKDLIYTKFVINKTWLLEKIDELLNKK